MKIVYSFLIIFFIVSVFLKIINIILFKKNGADYNKAYLRYMVKSYGIKLDLKKYKVIEDLIVLSNAFTIASISIIFLFLKVNYFIQIIITFILCFGLLLSFYNLIGIILRKKGW